jgi:mannose/cellobiose epimerase-like protein (N-acyl-D-glucosamine 2-epimerase family)
MSAARNPERVRAWLADTALPFWAGAGVDGTQGFAERLRWDGSPDLGAPKRLRVQARQVYVFSHAHMLGLMPGADRVAGQGYEFVTRHGFPDGIAGGAVHALSRDGQVVDARRDTYDHAFLLFAWSWFHRATGRADVREAVLALGDATWALLRHPGGEGFLVDDRSSDGRGSDELHQNPHMHLFEAVLAAWEATGEPVFRDRARELFELFRDRLFDRERGVILEYRDARWNPAPGARGALVEPGHHMEWVWLLAWYARVMAKPLADEARRLHAFATRHGRPGGGVLLCDELEADGRVRSAATRSWPQTEALKAEVALAEADGRPLPPLADDIVAALFDTYLGRPVPGGWIDWVDGGGRPLVERIPASTFYHLFLGFAEYLRVAR